MTIRSMIFAILFILNHVTYLVAMEGSYTFKVLQGQEVAQVAYFVAQSIREQFSGYPYFYAGDEDNDQEYMKWFTALSNLAVAVVYCNDQPVGFVTGIPCVDFQEGAFKQAEKVFSAHGLDYRNFYYIAEVIVLPAHRNQKLAEELYYMIEARAQELGYSYICYAKESDEEHPRKPAGYKGLGRVFRQEGGYQRTNMIVCGSWLTYNADGSIGMQEHTMRYWIKPLSKK